MQEPVWKNRSREERIRFYEQSRPQNIRQKKQKRQVKRLRQAASALMVIAAFFAGIAVGKGCSGGNTVIAAEREAMAEAFFQEEAAKKRSTSDLQKTETVDTTELPDYVDEQYLTVNPYSRPGKKTDTIQAVVIHYLANPGTTAQQNRDYFEELSKGEDGVSISSNFVIGLEGEVIACVPPGEVAYASNNRNSDTVSIENCHPDVTGKFNPATYESLVKLTGWLCCKYQLDPLNGGVIRHYEVTGKICPKYFVENEEAWQAFLQDVQDWIDTY